MSPALSQPQLPPPRQLRLLHKSNKWKKEKEEERQ
jgi:hypothetical protein